MAGTGDLINNERSDGLLIEPIESIEMKPLNNTNPVIPSNTLFLDMPPDCCPKTISKYFDCCEYLIPPIIQRQWAYLRSKALQLVEHRFFEWLIIASILASSTTLVSRKKILDRRLTNVYLLFKRHWKISIHDKNQRFFLYYIHWINFLRLFLPLNWYLNGLPME